MKSAREKLIEKHLLDFKNIDGSDMLATCWTIDFNESLLDLELTDEDSIWNVIYENEGVSIRINVNSEKQQGIRIVNIPDFIASSLFLAYQSGTESAITLLQKRKYEDNCYKRNIKIPYDNVT